MNLCFATNNAGKLDEIKALLAEKYTVLSLKDIGCKEELPETDTTIEGNSRQKAAYIWENYSVNCFSDDTGLEVEALSGAPGVYSAMYAGPACIAEENIKLLLKNMDGITNRKAKFRTCITLIIDGTIRQFEGNVTGQILLAAKGSGGFGYDPVFQPEAYDQSFAEISVEEKNKISHRGNAVRALVDFLNENFQRINKGL